VRESKSSNTFLGHPKGLVVCFMTELWERFAYYGMLSLLILYLTQFFQYSDAEGSKVVAAYGALVWMLPVLGGVLADRLLGSRKCVVVGALMMSIGFISISFPSVLLWQLFSESETYTSEKLFFSMALIVTGVGLLKTNITTVVGALYSLDDHRRDSGFTTFYMGINIGGALGPIVCGGIATAFGMSYGFAAAGIGMLIGLVTFLYGQKYLGDKADPPNKVLLKRSLLGVFNVEWGLYLGAILFVWVMWQALNFYADLPSFMLWFFALLGGFILYFSLFRCSAEERNNMIFVTISIVFAIVFWSLYMQLFSSITLFMERMVDRRIWGIEISSSQLIGLPSILVISLAPLLSYVWLRCSSVNKNPSLMVKFALSLFLIGLAFLVPALGQFFSSEAQKISLIWLLFTFVFIVIGELCQSPIAMNMITKLCPKRVVGMMMGAYFVSLSIGSIVAGELSARFLQVDLSESGELVNPSVALDTYISAFSNFGIAACIVSIVMLALTPMLNRLAR